MKTTALTQPATQLGLEIDNLLNANNIYSRVVFVSAFVALKTILRLREQLLEAKNAGATLRLVVGVDLGGTSREVLEELLKWDCEVFVCHNPVVRATFHPKLYLFEAEGHSTVFLGSNNLTDGGFFTNYEATTRYDFDLSDDVSEYKQLLNQLSPFIEPEGTTVRPLDLGLIEALSARGILLSEAEARRNRQRTFSSSSKTDEMPPNPFSPAPTPYPPLLPPTLRGIQEDPPPEVDGAHSESPLPEGILVWEKTLTKSDALNVKAGSHPKNVVLLTQAKFKDPDGTLISQQTYFRNLFARYAWEPEAGGHPDQEHAFVPFRILIRGVDHGVHNFEISHKPSGEAGQGNSPTSLRWGGVFSQIVLAENLTGAVFSLYETAENDLGFLINIYDA